ncbi:MAG: winged helix-turn-helix domain-containing protein [Candidatus Thorarchaeota archaeon]
MSSQNPDNDDNGKSEAFLFEAISHDTRIRILFLLSESIQGFSELKHKLGIKSSGNLQHHLLKLGILIEVNEGMYSLSDHGREAIMAIEAVRRMQNRKRSERIIITMVYAFSIYVAFMNVPFLVGSVDANTPLMALGIAAVSSTIFYLAWPFAISRQERKQTYSKSGYNKSSQFQQK